MEIRIGREYRDLDLIARTMGLWHRYYAESAVKNGGYIAELYLNSVRIAQAVIYDLDLGDLYRIGVIYYIAVDQKYRGRGYGRKLLSEAERFLESERRVNIFMASTTSDNASSINLFRSSFYREYSWSDIYRLYGSDIADILLRILCSYEDELLFIKTSGNIDHDRFLGDLKNIGKGSRKSIKSWWYRTCYKPWLELRSRLQHF